MRRALLAALALLLVAGTHSGRRSVDMDDLDEPRAINNGHCWFPDGKEGRELHCYWDATCTDECNDELNAWIDAAEALRVAEGAEQVFYHTPPAVVVAAPGDETEGSILPVSWDGPGVLICDGTEFNVTSGTVPNITPTVVFNGTTTVTHSSGPDFTNVRRGDLVVSNSGNNSYIVVERVSTTELTVHKATTESATEAATISMGKVFEIESNDFYMDGSCWFLCSGNCVPAASAGFPDEDNDGTRTLPMRMIHTDGNVGRYEGFHIRAMGHPHDCWWSAAANDLDAVGVSIWHEWDGQMLLSGDHKEYTFTGPNPNSSADDGDGAGFCIQGSANSIKLGPSSGGLGKLLQMTGGHEIQLRGQGFGEPLGRLFDAPAGGNVDARNFYQEQTYSCFQADRAISAWTDTGGSTGGCAINGSCPAVCDADEVAITHAAGTYAAADETISITGTGVALDDKLHRITEVCSTTILRVKEAAITGASGSGTIYDCPPDMDGACWMSMAATTTEVDNSIRFETPGFDWASPRQFMCLTGTAPIHVQVDTQHDTDISDGSSGGLFDCAASSDVRISGRVECETLADCSLDTDCYFEGFELNGRTYDEIVTVMQTAPIIEFRDADTADRDVNADISVACSDPNSTTEDCDFTVRVQQGGAIETRISIDSDGGDTYGSAFTNFVKLETAGTGDTAIQLPNDSIGNAEVADDITASSYVLKAGDTMTGGLIMNDGVAGSPSVDFVTTGGETWVIASAADSDLLVTHTGAGTENLDLVSATGTVDVIIDGDLTVQGDDLFMTTNTAGMVLIADGTNYNPTAQHADTDITTDLEEEGVTCTGCIDVTNMGANSVDGSELVDGSVDATELDLSIAPTWTGAHTWTSAGSQTFNDPVILASDYIEGTEAAAPGTPAAGQVRLYAKSGAPGEFCSKDDAGVETCMSAGAGAGDSVSIDGVGATDPDFTSDGDLDATRCTGAGAPHADCTAAEDVVYHYNADTIAVADLSDTDFGDWACVADVCTLEIDVVAAAEMADADHGDVAWSAGVATVENLQCTACVDATDMGTDSVSADELNAAGVASELETAMNHDNITGFVADEHVAHTGVTLTAGAGLSGGGDISVNRSFATASGEEGFLASGALTCGASTAGKVQVHTTPLQYCDNAVTPALQYAAYADSAGLITDFSNANDLDAAGDVADDSHNHTTHTGTITWGGTSVLESGPAFAFGDGTEVTLTHTYANTGTDVVIAYSTGAMGVTGALTATNLSGTNTGDDDVPESGDFGNAADLETTGALSANTVDANELVDDSVDTTELDDVEAPGTGQLVATDNVTATRLEYIAVGDGLTHDGDTLTADLGTAIVTGEITDGTITGDDFNANVAGDGLVKDTAATPDELDIDLNATLDGVGFATSLSGLEFTATNELALIQGCGDNDVLKWQDAGATWDCKPDNSGSAPAWDTISDPGANQSLTMGTNTTTWAWSLGSDAALDAVTMTLDYTAAGDVSEKTLMTLRRPDGGVADGAVTSLLDIDNADTDDAVTAGIRITSAAGVMTNAIDFGATNITNLFDTPSGASITGAEVDRLDGLAGVIATDATAVTDLEGTGLAIAAATLGCTDAAADDSTKGCATFDATRFSAVSGNIDIASVAGLTGANEDDLTDDVLTNIGDVTATPADGMVLVRDETTDTNWEGVSLSGDVASVSVLGLVDLTDFVGDVTGDPEATVVENVTCSGSCINSSELDDAITVDTLIAATDITLGVGDVADGGVLQMLNAATVCWEASPAGTDVCIAADASEIIQVTGGTLDAGDLSGAVPTGVTVGADHIDAIAEIAATLKSGADGTLITGTSGSDTHCAQWNVDGDLVTSGASCGGTTSWDTIGDPAGAGAVAFAGNAQTMDWVLNADTATDALTLTFDYTDTGDLNEKVLLTLQRPDSLAEDGALTSLLDIDNADPNDPVTAGIRIRSAAGTMTTGIDLNDTDITTPLLLPLANTPATPAIAFGDGDTGFFQQGDGNVRFSSNGADTWQFSGSRMGSGVANKPALLDEATTTTNPNIIPDSGDLDTGLGQNGDNELSLIAGGVEIIRLDEDTVDTVTVTADVIDLSAAGNAGGVEIPNATAKVDTDCDAAGEEGRIFIDTDAAAGSQLYVCAGAGPAWVLADTDTTITEVNDLNTVTWVDVPDANVNGSAERNEVCDTTDLSATCEINSEVIVDADINPAAAILATKLAGARSDEALCYYELTGTKLECTVADKAALEAHISDVADFAMADGDAYTGDHNLANATVTIDMGTVGTLNLDETVAPTAEGMIAWDPTNDELEVGETTTTAIFKQAGTFTDEALCTAESTGNQFECSLSATEGSIIIGESTPLWTTLGIGASNAVLLSNGTTAAWDATPAIDCTDCTGVSVSDLNNVGNVTLTTPGDGSVLCFTGAANASVDCTVGGDATATEDTGTLTLSLAANSVDADELAQTAIVSGDIEVGDLPTLTTGNTIAVGADVTIHTATAAADTVTIDTDDAGATIVSRTEYDIHSDAWYIGVGGPIASFWSGTSYTYPVLEFADGGSDLYAYIEIEVPEFIDNTQDIAFTFNWSSTATAGTVCWCINPTVVTEGGDYDAALGTAICDQDTTAGTADFKNSHTFSGADLWDHAATVDDSFVLRIYRDVDGGAAGCTGDTMTATARLHSVKMDLGMTR